MYGVSYFLCSMYGVTYFLSSVQNNLSVSKVYVDVDVILKLHYFLM
jgi:hypothetical protein